MLAFKMSVMDAKGLSAEDSVSITVKVRQVPPDGGMTDGGVADGGGGNGGGGDGGAGDGGGDEGDGPGGCGCSSDSSAAGPWMTLLLLGAALLKPAPVAATLRR